MAIISVQEETRQGQHAIGGSPQLTRTFIVTLSAQVPAAALVSACGVPLGSPHPDYPDAVVVDVSFEQSRLETAQPEDPEQANQEVIEEAQQNTPLPLPPPEILETELPGLLPAPSEEGE